MQRLLEYAAAVRFVATPGSTIIPIAMTAKVARPISSGHGRQPESPKRWNPTIASTPAVLIQPKTIARTPGVEWCR